jgi:hypothetical protein
VGRSMSSLEIVMIQKRSKAKRGAHTLLQDSACELPFAHPSAGPHGGHDGSDAVLVTSGEGFGV